MGWMRENKLRLKPNKTEVLLAGSNLITGSGHLLPSAGVAFTPSPSVPSSGVLLDPGLLLEGQMATVARGAY